MDLATLLKRPVNIPLLACAENMPASAAAVLPDSAPTLVSPAERVGRIEVARERIGVAACAQNEAETEL